MVSAVPIALPPFMSLIVIRFANMTQEVLEFFAF